MKYCHGPIPRRRRRQSSAGGFTAIGRGQGKGMAPSSARSHCVGTALLVLTLSGCAHAAHDDSRIRLNQLGFLVDAPKQAVVVAPSGDRFSITDTGSNTVVFEGQLTPAAAWQASGETVRIADFSALTQPGEYRLAVEGLSQSVTVSIGMDVYAPLAAAALKAFYFNRSGTALATAHAGRWARAAGHPDTRVAVHESAASSTRPVGTYLSAPKGWYDAGDYNKYVVNSGISTYTLLAAFEHFPDYHRTQNLDIPESDDAVPDILDEAYWNLHWMLAMQDPDDGGVYHKLTTLEFAAAVMPNEAHAQRFVVQKSTAAALNFAAVMAAASRIYSSYERSFPGLAERSRKAAGAAYEWALHNPTAVYVQPGDVQTGEYGDNELDDEFFWAATELYLATGKAAYLDDVESYAAPISTPNWQQVAGLAYLSLHTHNESLPDVWQARVVEEFARYAQTLTERHERSAYGIAYGGDLDDFHWGGTGTAMNQSLLLIRAFVSTGERRYLDAASANFDYVFGRNATGYSFVTGFGQHTPMHIHHRVSAADGIPEPVPGLLVGGPNTNGQDGCKYPSELPARSYLDDWCSYTTNEVAINWNAPLVYVATALQALARRSTD